MYTKKTYVKIAESIRNCKVFLKDNPQTSAEDILAYLTGYLSAEFALDNPRFNSDKFKAFINKE